MPKKKPPKQEPAATVDGVPVRVAPLEMLEDEIRELERVLRVYGPALASTVSVRRLRIGIRKCRRLVDQGDAAGAAGALAMLPALQGYYGLLGARQQGVARAAAHRDGPRKAARARVEKARARAAQAQRLVEQYAYTSARASRAIAKADFGDADPKLLKRKAENIERMLRRSRTHRAPSAT